MRKYNLIFFLVIFLIGTDTFLISPLLPTLASTYHISTGLSGWMVSAYAIGYACFALIAGPYSDGRDRKRVSLIGLTGFSLATFLCGFAVSFPLMLLFRFLAGVAASFVTPQIWAAIPTVAPKKEVVKMIGIASSGLAVAQIAGVPIGAFLAGLDWRAPFFVIAVLALVMLLIIGRFLPSIKGEKQQNRGFIAIYRGILSSRKSLLYLLGYLLFQLGFFMVFIFTGTWFAQRFGLSVAAIGGAMIAIGTGQFIGSFFGSKLVARLGLAKSMIYGVLLQMLLILAVPFAPTLYLAVSLLVFAFMIGGFIYPVFMKLIQSSAENALGTISSLANVTMYLGTTLAGIIGGLLFSTALGFLAIALFCLAVQLLSLAVYGASGLFTSKTLE